MHRHGWLALALGLAALVAALTLAGDPAEAAVHPTAAHHPPMVTLLFSRTEVGTALACRPEATGFAGLRTVVAPYLAARGLRATGTLTTGAISETAPTCTHFRLTSMGSWSDARALARDYGWSFVSHTDTYPARLDGLTPAQSDAETCGSANKIDAHGLPGGHGLIAYPGVQVPPVALQTGFGSVCFAWGRVYSSLPTAASAGTTPPFWETQGAINGGPCAVRTARCYGIASTGGSRYRLPSLIIARINALVPDQWLTLQAYVLVTGKRSGTSPAPAWDCTATDPHLHWTNDNERYCWNDYQTVLAALVARRDVLVVDPLTAGIAFGRPATYPTTALPKAD